jgi:hypothetical protein
MTHAAYDVVTINLPVPFESKRFFPPIFIAIFKDMCMVFNPVVLIMRKNLTLKKER